MKYSIALLLAPSLVFAQLGEKTEQAGKLFLKLGFVRKDADVEPPLNTQSFGVPAANTTRPQLAPYLTSNIFRKDDMSVSFVSVAGIVSKIEIYFRSAVPSDSVAQLLERYSGVAQWSQRKLPDSSFEAHFPHVNQRDPGRSFFTAPG